GWVPGTPLLDPMCGSGTLLIEAGDAGDRPRAGLMRSGWVPGTPLLDPMCGSGTLLIEAGDAGDRPRAGL
ncbi:hypothetical protein C0Q16_29690, partial [Klebsiella pneumoniae]